jgi:acyl carrier protein
MEGNPLIKIENEILDTIAKTARVDRSILGRDAPLETVGIDSLEVIEIVFDIEEKFGVRIPFNSNDPQGAFSGAVFRTVGDVLDVVTRLVADKGGADPQTPDPGTVSCEQLLPTPGR